MHTVPAEVDESGKVTLLEKVNVSSKRRALVMIFDEQEPISEAALLSEAALAEDWNRPEEDVAWSGLQSAR